MSETSDGDRTLILAGLAPLFDDARQRGLWFHCSYQDLWFSPDELAAEHANGRFVWGTVSWKLRPPQEHLDALKKAATDAEIAIERFRKRMHST